MTESIAAHRETASAKNNSNGNLKSNSGEVSYTTTTVSSKGTTGVVSTYKSSPTTDKYWFSISGGVTQASIWGQAHATETHSSFFINFTASTPNTRLAYAQWTGSLNSTDTITTSEVGTQTDPPFQTEVTVSITTFTSVDQQKASATWYYKPVTTTTTTTSPTLLI